MRWTDHKCQEAQRVPLGSEGRIINCGVFWWLFEFPLLTHNSGVLSANLVDVFYGVTER